MSDVVLEVRDLHTHIRGPAGIAKALNGVTFDVHDREIVGLIGETGAGKSLTAMSVLGLVQPPIEVVDGAVMFGGQDLTTLDFNEFRSIRGMQIGLIVQNPRGALDPMRPIGKQLADVFRVHQGGSKSSAQRTAIEMLGAVGIPDAERRYSAYSYELSGGMAQRVMIAMAMINEPTLLIADEPTTGLDVTVQAQILDLIKDRVTDVGSSVLLITHDLGVVAHYCDRVIVMFAGRVVEEATIPQLFDDPQHPYTQALVASLPHRLQLGEDPPASGLPPDLINLPDGCHYAYRCPHATELCRTPVPMVDLGGAHRALCHFPHR